MLRAVLALALLGFVGLLWNVSSSPTPSVVQYHKDLNIASHRSSGWLKHLFGNPVPIQVEPVKEHPAHPTLSEERLKPNTSRPIPHIGKSRIPIAGDNQYEERPLPSLNEAFDRLVPRLRAIQDAHSEVPREHDLGAPIFPPFLTQTLKERYLHLGPEFDHERQQWVPGTEKRYFVVAVCRQVAGMLADWFATWTVLADFLGPESLAFSLHEGASDDGSAFLLEEMRNHLLFLGVPPENIHVTTGQPHVDWEVGHRIELLARMRNAVMQPFYDSDGLAPDGVPWSALVWHNDVYFGAGHMLELLHQHYTQDADMTCGWDHAGKWFYDGWVGRDIEGDLYTPFPVPEEDQPKPQKLFPSSPISRERHERLLPYQVFTGWNGMTVLSPTPFFAPYYVRFRRGTPRRSDQKEGEEECQASESQFIPLDFWKWGFGRIQTVPGVHLTYGKGDAKLRGWVEYPQPEPGYSEAITWRDEPPKKVRCHDWPDKIGKNYWAWDNVRWVDPPALEIPDRRRRKPSKDKAVPWKKS